MVRISAFTPTVPHTDRPIPQGRQRYVQRNATCFSCIGGIINSAFEALMRVLGLRRVEVPAITSVELS